MSACARRGRTGLKRIAPLVALTRFVRALATPLGRGRLAAQMRGAQLYQPATVTWPDRHAALAAFVAARFAGAAHPRLLSFGCSTGEEAFTLARALTHAEVDAIDANPACIARARRAAGRAAEGARIRFLCADAPGAFAAAPYDAVLCLSVLRHGDLEALMPESCAAVMPFARFAAAIVALDACVRPGGLLILWGCNFRLTDTPVAARYRPLAVPGARVESGPFWGPDDRLLPDAGETASVFVKQACP